MPAPTGGTHSDVGVDLSITTFATLSTGVMTQNSRHMQHRAELFDLHATFVSQRNTRPER